MSALSKKYIEQFSEWLNIIEDSNNNIFFKFNFDNNFLVTNYWSWEYYKIILYFIIAYLICYLLAKLAIILSKGRIKDNQKLGSYECGFDTYDNATRLPFEVHYYLVGILFLIFDVEVALIFPWTIASEIKSFFEFYGMVGFLIILTFGFIYEWKGDALNWPKKALNIL